MSTIRKRRASPSKEMYFLFVILASLRSFSFPHFKSWRLLWEVVSLGGEKSELKELLSWVVWADTNFYNSELHKQRYEMFWFVYIHHSKHRGSRTSLRVFITLISFHKQCYFLLTQCYKTWKILYFTIELLLFILTSWYVHTMSTSLGDALLFFVNIFWFGSNNSRVSGIL